MKALAIKALGISGSLREGSTNTIALKEAVRVAEAAGAEVELLNLRDLDIPIYDQDIEDAGTPKGVKILREKIKGADVILIASPEYNHSISGALKNAIDWASLKGNAFDAKVAAIFGASSGGFGTVRGQMHLREILRTLNCFILPKPEVFISRSGEAFDENGEFKDEKLRENLEDLILKTLEFAKKIK